MIATFILTNVAAKPAITVTPIMLAASEITPIFSDNLSIMLVPRRRPYPPITSLIANNVTFSQIKNNNGAIATPSIAIEAKIVENNGAIQNCDNESPIPAKGPINAILIPRISSYSIPFSAIAK